MTPEEMREIHKINELILREMAEAAFDVLNWARREGFKKDQQIEQVVSTFRLMFSEKERKE